MQNKIPVFGIPILNRGDLLERLIKSLDYPVARLVIVNNGHDKGVSEVIEKIKNGLNPLIDKVEIYSAGKNLGVAPSWNFIISKNSDAPYWFICANDMFFHSPGALEKMYKHAQSNHLEQALMCAHGYSCFCVTKLGWDKIGSFDENIFPAYMEDCDHFYRVGLSNLPVSGFDVEMTHGDQLAKESSTIHSNEKYAKANSITHHQNTLYYIEKWGGINGKETYTTPFNNPDLPLSYWTLDKERRKSQELVWQEITSEKK